MTPAERELAAALDLFAHEFTHSDGRVVGAESGDLNIGGLWVVRARHALTGVCPVCGQDMKGKRSWQRLNIGTKRERRICLECGPLGWHFGGDGTVLAPDGRPLPSSYEGE